MTQEGKKTQNREKLQLLLRELFQFDSADLDFGIYRIMNEKRDEIERFIEEDLLDAVERGLAEFGTAERGELERQLAEKRAQLGEAAFDKRDAVRKEFQELNIAQEFMELRQQLDKLELAGETEARIFNDLYTFFRRYYDNGDFLTERRYSSKDAKFCVPYNGEEVLLHWANRDQYYVKTTERFTDYRFSAGDYTVWFRLERAEVPQDDVKGDKRYFVLREETPFEFDEESKTLTLFFEHKPITDDEKARFLSIYNARQSKSKRRKTLDRAVLCEALETGILEGLDQPDLKAHLAVVPEDDHSSMLGQHLNRYTARNTMDYFVHKNLGGFLRRELDSCLKTEVLRLDEVIADKGSPLSAHLIARARVVRQIADRIIAFLAQIEDLQKRLFEKKKFVVQTDYCITLDRVPGEFYAGILANEVQLKEWRQLYNMGAWGENLLWTGEFDAAFLRSHPYFMLDTAFFQDDFKAQLLETFDDLDGAIDGLLIHGENLQALNLLQTKYAGQVKCIYIDPPYNTGSDDNFPYKDNYQHSSWLSMMHDRLGLAHRLLTSDGVVFVSIDDREKSKLRELMDIVYGKGSFIASFARKRRAPSAMSQDMVSQDHEYVLAYGGADFTTLAGVDKDYSAYSNPDNDSRGDWVAGDLTVGMTREQRPNQYYNLVDPTRGKVYPPDENRVWAYYPETMQQKIEEELVIFPEDTSQRPKLKRFRKDLKTATNPISTWIDTKANDEQGDVVALVAGLNTEGTREIQSLFEQNVFSYAKPTSLVRALAEQTTDAGDMVMDFFAGSGTTAHAVMGLNSQNGGSRRYILVEVGAYYDDVLKPRIESYEDALNNIRVCPPEAAQHELLYEEADDYLLSYMLDFESRESPTLLSWEAFERPFQFTLKIQGGHESPRDTAVDLVETFHYLIGMQVRRLEQHRHQNRRYVVSRGEMRTEQGLDKVVTIWRHTESLDLEEESDWAKAELLTESVDRVYVNGPSFIEKAEPLEITFRQRMEGGLGGA